MRKSIVLVIVVLLAINLTHAQNIVPLGKGSYSYTPPAYSAGRYDLFPWPDERGEGDKAYSMVYNREIYVVEDNEKPIPTNDWLTSIFKNQYSGELWAYPLLIDAESYGLHIEYPHTWNSTGRHMTSNSELELKAEGFTATAALAQNWGDWTMEFVMPANEDEKMTVTLGHGLPYVWVETENIMPYIEGDFDAFFNAAGETVTFPLTADNIGIEIDGDYYGVFVPSGTSFEQADNKLSINIPESNGYVIVAALPTQSELLAYYDYAYTLPRDTRVDYNYIEEDGKLYTTWNITSENLKGEANTDVIQGFIPHHYRTTDLGFSFDADLSYETPRGTMQSAIGNNFSIDYNFNGLLPVFPRPEDYDVDYPFDSALVKQGIEDFTSNTTYGSDTYWGGKDLLMKAQYAMLANSMDMPEASTKIQENLVSALSDWYTFDKGEMEYCFTYYPNWGAMVGFNTSYFSDEFTDHHFHYGYFSLASGILGLINNSFVEDYGPMAKLVASDYANWKRDDDKLPYFRTMDIWAGHSYAGGLVDGGNGQESSSEAMQSWGGLFMLAMATNDNDMRDAAIFGYVSEAQGTAEYWFDRYKVNPEDDFPARNNIPESYDQPYNTNLESGGIGYWNWFSGNMGFNHAIQWIPWSPILKYFNEDLEFAQYEHDFVLANWVNNEDGWATETEYYEGWAGMASIDILSVANPEAAVAKLQECRDEGLAVGTDALRHYNIHSPRTYGRVVWDKYIDYPLSTIYYNEASKQYSYVVFNAENAEKTFNVYDYEEGLLSSFKAPAGRLTTYRGNPVLSSIEIFSDVITAPVGDSILFSAQAYDQYFATIESNINWSVSGGGTISNSGVFVAASNGEYELTASDGEVEKTISIRVNAAPQINDIVISAKSFVLEQETEMQFEAVAYDQYGDSYNFSPTWSISGGGDIDAGSGLMLANSDVGIYTLTVESEGLTRTAEVIVRMPLVNVAVGKDAYCSSTENVEYPAEDAVDGVESYQSRWSSSFNDNEYWALDLGSSYDIDYINIVWQTSCAKVYEIYTSNVPVDLTDIENHDWGTPIYSNSNGNAGAITIDVSEELQYFYVKCIERINQYGFSIIEFEAYGLPVSGAGAQLTSIHISPSYPEISDLDSIQLSAVGYDQFGDEVAITPSWSMLDDTQGTVTSDGWFKPAEWARGIVNVNARANNIIGFGPVVVQPSYEKVVSVEVLPTSDTSARVSVADGVPYKFNALVINQFSWEIEGDIQWSVSGGGTITQNGYFTANASGDYEIYASCQGIVDTAFVSVTSISGVNIALNKPSWSSSVETINAPENAVDGSGSTRWASAWLPEAEWGVNLEAIYNLSSVEIDWQNAHAEQYTIETSLDGENWTTAFTQADGNGGNEVIDMTGVNAKYIRIVCTERYMEMYGYSIFEFRAFATGIDETPVLSTIEITPGRSWISSNADFTYGAIGYDQFGDVISLNSIEWSVSGSGSIDNNGVYTPDNAGNFFINVSSEGVTASTKVTVLADPVLEVNQLPVCALIAPASGRVIVNEELLIEASAIDYDGEIQMVEFFVDEIKVGEDSIAPYSINWTPEQVKDYEITAVAYDDIQSTISPSLTLRGVELISVPLLVLSPLEEQLMLDQAVKISAEALYFQTELSLVEFFVNGEKIAEVTAAPYETEWTPSVEMSYDINAVGTDEDGTLFKTDTVTVIVGANKAPQVEMNIEIDTLLLSNTLSMEAVASDVDGNIAKVEFFVDDLKIGEDMLAPYVLDWTPSSIGSYELYAMAYDNFGLSTKTETKVIVVVEEEEEENSLSDNANNSASLYPNPTSNLLYIKSDNQFNQYLISNVNGIVVKSGVISSTGVVQLSMDDLSTGIYFISLRSCDLVEVYRFVKN